MPETSAEIRSDYFASSAQFSADVLCDTRPSQARVVAGEIINNSDYHSWKLAGKIALIGTLDKVDGMLSRWAAKRLGVETTPDGAEKDQLNDKKWTYTMLGALASRAFMDGDVKYGSFLMAQETAIRTRDQLVNEKRREAEEQGLDAKAQWPGKIKTFAQNLTFTVATSPFARKKHGRKLVYAMQSVSTGLSVYSGRSLVKSLNQNIKTAIHSQ